jgi:TolB-like protein/Flp pilus assembly protein TadD
MATESRKLAAIMFTDMVGYSAMSQKNEALALELLELHRVLLRKIFNDYSGIEIKTIGDAFLVEFASALDAVNCSIEIQQKLQEYIQSSSEERKIFLRIGIHMGDVVNRDGDIYGDGVNIASRIEPLAKPGGICISENVAREVQNKLKVPMEKMGKQELKNIELPMEIYQIQMYEAPKIESPQADINKLAVLPFQNISPDKDSDYFSDGLTEELIMHLSGIKELKVISRTTISVYKNTQKDMQAIGSELKVRYILEGSVRKYNDDLRITAQLIDVKTDTHLWAETFKGKMEDIFDIQESVAKEVVKAMRLELSPAEKVALGRRATHSSEALDLNLHAREFLFRYTKSYLLASIDLFQKAIELDSRYAGAYAGLGEAYAIIYQWHDNKPIWLDKAMESSLKALMYDASSSEAYSALGLIYHLKQSYQEALEAIQKAIELDADNFFAYWTRGRIYRALDRDAEAVEQFNKVLELNPDFHSAYTDLRMEYKKLGEQEKLAELIGRALLFYPPYLLRHPDDARAHIFFSGALQYAGRIDEAKSQMSRAIDLSPNDVNMIYNAACFYSRMNEKTIAVEHLQRAITNGYADYEYIKHDPDFDSIRDDPGYLELMKGK